MAIILLSSNEYFWWNTDSQSSFLSLINETPDLICLSIHQFWHFWWKPCGKHFSEIDLKANLFIHPIQMGHLTKVICSFCKYHWNMKCHRGAITLSFVQNVNTNIKLNAFKAKAAPQGLCRKASTMTLWKRSVFNCTACALVVYFKF